MNNTIKGEMLVVLNNEQVCDDCQIRILAQSSKFLNNTKYMDALNNRMNDFFKLANDDNFFIILPKVISLIVDLNKTTLGSNEVCVDYMKFIIYILVYNYLDSFQASLLNKLKPGEFRICFINLLDILLTKPKNIKIKKESIFHMLISCICGDDAIKI